MKQLALIILLGLSVSTLHAQSIENLSPEAASRVYTEVAGELQVCSAYFQLASECMNNTQAGAGDKMKQLSDRTLENAAVILLMSSTLTLEINGQEYDQAKLWDKTQVSAFRNYERNYNAMTSEMMTCQNLSILSTKHLDPCVSHYQDPDALVAKWVKKLSLEEIGK